MTVALRILLGLYILQGLAKFVSWQLVPYERRIEQMARNYRDRARLIKASDAIVLALQAVLVALLAASGLEHVSFITGLMVGMTLMQLFFHSFDQPLPPDRAPDPPASPIRTMSWAIQSAPNLAWQQMVLQSALFVWALYMLITHSSPA